MIQINKQKTNCCGCRGCVQICPKQCISMQEDNEGFLYPVVDTGQCIDCNLCEKVCPEINTDMPDSATTLNTRIYGVKNINGSVCLNSSSGGIFSALAERIISEGGIVFGACLNGQHEVVHKYAANVDDLVPLMKSKYVQSNIGNCFLEVKQFLNSGKKVLFTGTPCQIAGLKSYLRKDYDSLYTAEVICHGVPSPGIWRRYLTEVANGDISRIRTILFREKLDNLWYNWYFIIRGNDSRNIVSQPTGDNPFIRAFLSNISLRPKCYECQYKSGRSGADLTLGDFWSIDRISPEFFDEKGVSLVVTHTAKGEKMINNEALKCKSFPNEDASRLNKAYSESVRKTFHRKRFFNLINKDNMSITDAIHKVIPRHSDLSAIQKIAYFPYRVMGLLSRKLHVK